MRRKDKDSMGSWQKAVGKYLLVAYGENLVGYTYLLPKDKSK